MGLWHGAPQWSGVTIDLGLMISNDAILFRQPAPGNVYIPIGPDGTWDQGGLMQGQGFENVGDKTYLYYGAADPRTWTAGDKPIPARGGQYRPVAGRPRWAASAHRPARRVP